MSFNALAGDNGILRNAANSKDVTGVAQIQEDIRMAYNNAGGELYG